MRSYAHVVEVLAVLAAVFQAAVCQSEQMGVDFGNGLVQDQFAQFPTTPGPYAHLDVVSTVGVGGTVGVIVKSSPAMDGFEWRIRDQLGSGSFVDLNALLHDFVFSWASTALTVTLNNLSAGTYTMTSYHHDTQFQDHGAIDIFVVDTDGLRQVAGGLVQTSGTSPSNVAQASFYFDVANGGSVTVTIAVTPGTGNAAVLNGFKIVKDSPIGVEQVSWGTLKCGFTRGLP